MSGFKSFANKTTIHFQHPDKTTHENITAIVGPNGSGKSNIADAIRWVLGEQSMKALRGKKTEDIIFSGSSKAPRRGTASVTLYFDNKNKRTPIDYKEFSITRTVHQDGNAEYLMNTKQVRLHDLHVLFARANIGQRTYSVISQGMIDAVLNAPPSERQEFFDEACGVKLFQIRKHRALLHMNKAEDRVRQTQIRLRELTARLKTLERYAKKYGEKAKIETTLDTVQTTYYGSLWRKMSKRLKEQKVQFITLEKQRKALARTMEDAQTDLQKMFQEKSQEEVFENLQKRYYGLKNTRQALTEKHMRFVHQMEHALEQTGRADDAWAIARVEEIKKTCGVLTRDIQQVDERLRHTRGKLVEERKQQEQENKKINAFENELQLLQQHARNKPEEIIQTIHALVEAHETIESHVREHFSSFHIAGEEREKKMRTLRAQLRVAFDLSRKLAQMHDARSEKIHAQQVSHLQTSLQTKKHERERSDKKIQALSFDQHKLQERKAFLVRERADKEREQKELEEKIRRAQRPRESKNIDDAKKEKEGVEQEMKEVDAQTDACEKEMTELHAREEKKKKTMFGLQKTLNENREQFDHVQSLLSAIRIDVATCEAHKESVAEELRHVVPADKQEAIYAVHATVSDDELEDLKRQMYRLRKQREEIGAIDEKVVEEYRTVAADHAFLTREAEDVHKALRSLQKVVSELDERIERTFRASFQKIQTLFTHYFTVLFGGGTATMKKIDVVPRTVQEKTIETTEHEEDTVRILQESGEQENKREKKYGVEIFAQPHGKKNRSTMMLSGGERSLVSLALLGAIVSSNPPPFIVLDEVDAALDEANSQRFASILADVSKNTQCITITHNRATMERASTLYGVTMGEDNISKLFSVRFEEVTEKN